jgi:acylpyruvate hydrolase
MRIFCVGRNYGAHARELKNEIPAEPVIFMKPESALVSPGGPVPYPGFSSDLHYETELVLRLSGGGKNLSPEEAGMLWGEAGLGLDFTARDIQQNLKTSGLPWELAKAFDGSALAAGFQPRNTLPAEENLFFNLLVNGEIRQEGQASDMLFSFPVLLSFLSRYFHLQPGDLVFTGTPAGVGPVKPGDRLQGFLLNEAAFDVSVA